MIVFLFMLHVKPESIYIPVFEYSYQSVLLLSASGLYAYDIFNSGYSNWGIITL